MPLGGVQIISGGGGAHPPRKSVPALPFTMDCKITWIVFYYPCFHWLKYASDWLIEYMKCN